MKKLSRLFGFLVLVALVLVAAACGNGSDQGTEQEGTDQSASDAPDKVVELNLGTFDPPEHVQTVAMNQFAADVEEATEGRVKITVHSGGALGSPAEVYDNTLTGIMDIGYGLHGYNPGVWDVSSVLLLPFLANAPAEELSAIHQYLYETYPEIQAEYEQFEPLYLFTADAYHIITKDKEIRTLDDVKGLKLRSPSNEGNEMLKAWGATPVNMPSPDIYDALQKGVIDGAVLPYSAIADFNLYDTINYITVIEASTAPFYVMANKNSWEKVSPEDQEIIKELAGERMARVAGKAFDERAEEARQTALDQGIELIELDETELNRFKEAAEVVTEDWIKKMEDRGIDGEAIVEDIRSKIGE